MPSNRAAGKGKLTIGRMTLDLERSRLLLDGADRRIRRQSFNILCLLANHRDQLVSRQHLLDEVWGNKVVTSDSLNQCLVEIRRLLRDESHRIVVTVRGRGYLLDTAALGAAAPRAWLTNRRTALFSAACLVLLAVSSATMMSPHTLPAVAPTVGPPTQLYADELVGQARRQLALMDEDLNARAREMLNQALAMNPDDADAITVLARAEFEAKRPPGDQSRINAWTRFLELTNQALAIEPEHAVANAQKGFIEIYYLNDFPSAARSFERAIRLDHADPEVLRLVTNAAIVFDRSDVGIELAKMSIASQPLCVLCHVFLSLNAMMAGDLHLAEDAIRRVLVFQPDYEPAAELLGDVLLEKGDTHGALVAYQRITSERPGLLTSKAIAYFRLGQFNKYERLRTRLIDRFGESSPLAVAKVEAATGDVEAAFRWVEKHLDNPAANRGLSYRSPFYENLRADPRWAEYRHRIGLSSQQLAEIRFNPSLPY